MERLIHTFFPKKRNNLPAVRKGTYSDDNIAQRLRNGMAWGNATVRINSSPKSRSTKSKSKSKSKSKKMRKGMYSDDEIAKRLRKGMAWGNATVRINTSPSTRSTKSKKSVRTPSTSPRYVPGSSTRSSRSRILSKFITPAIRNPSDLLAVFPIKINRISGSDLLAIVWDEEIIGHLRNGKPTTYNEHLETQKYTEYRLLHTIRQHKDLFDILAPGKGELLRIRFRTPVPVPAPAPAPAPAASFRRFNTPASFRRHTANNHTLKAAPAPIKLVKRTDIYGNFPVIVEARKGRPNESTHAIKLRGDFQKGRTPQEIAHVTAALMNALHASKYWKVLPPALPDELCRIEMSHDKK